MREVAIVGIGMVPVGEHWDKSLRELAVDAGYRALQDAGINSVDALYIGSAYGEAFSSQGHLGALIADHMGLAGIEAFRIEAADASGSAALRTAYLAVASGVAETVLVIGAEKSTDSIGSARTRNRAVSLDADFEAAHGATLPAMAALLMRRYMHEYGLELSHFEGFSVNAHTNGQKNAYAMFRNTIRAGAFVKAPMVAEPVNLFDSAPDADGAAALILTTKVRSGDLVPQPVQIAASAVATDTLMLQDRQDILDLKAARLSVERALQQAAITRKKIDLFELHDAFTVLTALSLEAAGFAAKGEGYQYAVEVEQSIGLGGKLPISTFGGLKSRGNPAGATGIYQVVEACMQLRGEADENQVHGAKTALIQNLGGLASTAIVHILQV